MTNNSIVRYSKENWPHMAPATSNGFGESALKPLRGCLLDLLASIKGCEKREVEKRFGGLRVIHSATALPGHTQVSIISIPRTRETGDPKEPPLASGCATSKKRLTFNSLPTLILNCWLRARWDSEHKKTGHSKLSLICSS